MSTVKYKRKNGRTQVQLSLGDWVVVILGLSIIAFLGPDVVALLGQYLMR